MTQEVLIVGAVRSPIARFRGALRNVRPDDLAAQTLQALIARCGIDPAAVDEVILGCANQAGEDNRNVARMATLLAQFPYEVPAVTVNRLCASGLEAFNQAARMIQTGDADLVIAGGVESMTRAPLSMPKPDTAFPTGNTTIYDTTLGWRFPNPSMEARFPLEPMGETAENIVDRLSISRADQDAWALRSHQRACAAQASGAFADELFSVKLPTRRGEPTSFDADECPRPDSTLAALSKLRPAFRADGSVTAGNSSTLNDGAAALLLASPQRAAALNLTPLARFRASASAGVDPRVMGLGPIPATQKALARANLSTQDLNLVELNEAFAAQALSVVRGLDLNPDIVNVNGGAIALGHPLGCSGARILTTLLFEMRRRSARYGLASLCVGVGQGVSSIIELS
jgi:acetyl-CoA acyltransferase